MCCFTLDVEQVAGTRIFARMRAPGRQLLVYQMHYAAREPLAMVLPIPVVAGAGDEAVRFIDLEACPDFFDELRFGFPDRRHNLEATLSLDDEVVEQATLQVHDVGAYEASFVPRPQDFARLDERFRLPLDLWLHLKSYADWGFAVFRLKPTTLAQVHPMAFEFPTRHPDWLFFPTLHIHHRRVPALAEFDHELYCQPEPAMNWHLHPWAESSGPAREFVRCAAALDLLDAGFPCWRATLRGQRQNRDAWLGRGADLPQWAAHSGS